MIASRAMGIIFPPRQYVITMKQQEQTFSDAKQRAYRFLAYRSLTTSELRERLQRRGYSAEIIEEVLRQLATDGYLDDRKLALEWARYRLQSKALGRRRLAWELQRRGLPFDLVQEVVGEVYSEFSEADLAAQAARKRLRSKGMPHSPRERQGLVRHLFSLGFEADAVTATLIALLPDSTMPDSHADDDSA
jgi:regulatory protein